MQNTGQRWRGWAEIGAMVALCGVLGALQYRWIGEVSVAERERLQASLQSGLNRLSQDFNDEISLLCRAIMRGGDTDYLSRLAAWQESGRHIGMLRSAFVARPEKGDMRLLRLNPETQTEEAIPWPGEWEGMRRQMLARLAGERGRGGVVVRGDLTLIDLPRFTRSSGFGPGGPGPVEQEWVLLDMDAQYLTTVLVPELLARHLGEPAAAEYRYGVSARNDAARLIAGEAVGQPDAQVALFQPQFETIFRRGGGPPGGRRGPPPNVDEGRWTLAIRNQAGSLEGVVARTRWRNLAVTGGILTLLLGAVGLILRNTRESQRLAEMQIDFVAGVSHELRTPLTVIRTAAYNLRGKIAANPAQVERYGGLIQQESEKLTALVEQVMQYASARAGKTIQGAREPVAIEALLEACAAANAALIEEAGCEFAVAIAPGLPLVLGDALALERAVNNLLVNAAKYGAGGQWIGLSAARAQDGGVEIRVADRGAGIPAAEQAHVFDAFFRGRSAVEDQVHGTGLGLNLVKGIVEAHGGTVTVKSAAGKGTEFQILLPAAPDGYQDEFTNSAH